ncbi:MAG: hypothetical protein AAFY88_20305 [Acidobacteriota bacterium]
MGFLHLGGFNGSRWIATSLCPSREERNARGSGCCVLALFGWVDGQTHMTEFSSDVDGPGATSSFADDLSLAPGQDFEWIGRRRRIAKMPSGSYRSLATDGKPSTPFPVAAKCLTGAMSVVFFALALFFWNADGVYRSGRFVPRVEQPTFFYNVVIHFGLLGVVALGLLLWTVFVPTKVLASRPQGPRRRSLVWRMGAAVVTLVCFGLLVVSFVMSETGEIRLLADLIIAESAEPLLFHLLLIVTRFVCCITLFFVVISWPDRGEGQRPVGATAVRRRLLGELGVACGLLALTLGAGWAVWTYELEAGEFTGRMGWIYTAEDDPVLFYFKLGTAALVSVALVTGVFYRIYVRFMNGEYRSGEQEEQGH